MMLQCERGRLTGQWCSVKGHHTVEHTGTVLLIGERHHRWPNACEPDDRSMSSWDFADRRRSRCVWLGMKGMVCMTWWWALLGRLQQEAVAQPLAGMWGHVSRNKTRSQSLLGQGNRSEISRIRDSVKMWPFCVSYMWCCRPMATNHLACHQWVQGWNIEPCGNIQITVVFKGYNEPSFLGMRRGKAYVTSLQ